VFVRACVCARTCTHASYQIVTTGAHAHQLKQTQ